MKKYLLTAIITAFVLTSFAQQKESFFTHLDSAKSYAQTHQTPILMVFAGSDWCRPCMQFKEQILLDSSFAQFASQQLTILYLDFPAKKKNKLAPELQHHHESLAKRFNKQGAFPHILLLNADEEVLARLAYRRQEGTAFIEEIKSYLLD